MALDDNGEAGYHPRFFFLSSRLIVSVAPVAVGTPPEAGFLTSAGALAAELEAGGVELTSAVGAVELSDSAIADTLACGGALAMGAA